ncbi:MAG: Cna B-type domain-containing protein [Lachnospiraceae bacterium]|jgi:hypothetical protein
MPRGLRIPIIFILLLSAMAVICVTASFAEWEMPDTSRTDCAVTLTYEDETGNPITGGGFTVYYVAGIKNDGGNLSFDISMGNFATSGAVLDDLEDPVLVEKLALFAEKNKLKGKTSSLDEHGKLIFSGLAVGVHLIVQTAPVEGYFPMEPFLITLPVRNADNDSWDYEVDALPKAKMNPLPVQPTDLSVRKKWIDDGKDRPAYITVQLLRSRVVYDEVRLSDENAWTHTWNDLDGNYLWSVIETNIPRGYSVSYESNGMVITITNTSSLIITGQLRWPVPLMASLGLLLLVTGCFLVFTVRKKKS